jgi:hypothetical protein
LGFGPALSADGATALVGAPEVRYGTGAADVFHVSKAGLWASSSTPTAILTVAALEPCVVPKLIGLTLSAAKSRLRARYCRLGRVRGGHLTAMKGRVVSQSRAPGLLLAPSAEVGVKIRK